MHLQLKKAVNMIGDKSLRRKVAALIENPAIEIEGKVYKGMPVEESPAGISHHHSYLGGLCEHMVSTMNIALALCDAVENVYAGEVDRDLVVAGVLVHDVFKALTYVQRENGTYASAPLAERLDHVTLGVAELVRRGFPLNGEVLRAAQYLLRTASCVELNRMTATEAFEIVNAKTRKGWEAVPKAFDKVRKRRRASP